MAILFENVYFQGMCSYLHNTTVFKGILQYVSSFSFFFKMECYIYYLAQKKQWSVNVRTWKYATGTWPPYNNNTHLEREG